MLKCCVSSVGNHEHNNAWCWMFSIQSVGTWKMKGFHCGIIYIQPTIKFSVALVDYDRFYCCITDYINVIGVNMPHTVIITPSYIISINLNDYIVE